MVAALRDYIRTGMLAGFRKDGALGENPDAPSLALAGYIWTQVDRAKTLALLHRCAEEEFAHPSDDDGQFDEVVSMISALSCQTKDYDTPAALRRRQYARGGDLDEAGVPSALLELFALHGQYGPLEGFDDDVKLAGPAISSPKIQYALSRMYNRGGQAGKAADAARQAFDASSTRRQRLRVGDFLADHEWDEPAKAEFQAALNLPPQTQREDYDEITLHFRLGFIAGKLGNDLESVREDEQGLEAVGGNGWLSNRGIGRIELDRMRAFVSWHYFRDADAKHDEKAAHQYLSQVVALKPVDEEIVIDVVPR